MKTLEQLQTPQEVFDYVARKLIAQGRPAVGDFGLCRYRAEGGCKCAAGHLIPDNEYRPDMEGKAVYVVAGSDPFCASSTVSPALHALSKNLPSNFVRRLQGAHDTAARAEREFGESWLDGWLERMKDVAREYGLDASVLSEASPAGAE